MKLYPKISRYFVLTGFALVGLASFYFGMKLATPDGDSRAPAAIPRRYDFSNLVGDELKVAAQERLVRGAKIVTAGTSVGVQLGHFQMRDSQKAIVGACDHYRQVEFIFHAGDMAVSGEPPAMIMTGPCESSDDGDEISPLMLDYMSIVKLPVFDREFRPSKSSLFSVKFVNVSDTWPKLWVMHSIKLIGVPTPSDLQLAQNSPQREPQQQSPEPSTVDTVTTPSQNIQNELSVSSDDIRRILGKAIFVEWP